MQFDQSTGFVMIDSVNYSYNLSFNNDVGQYQQGFFPIMMFCYPAAGLAVVHKIG
jgi:phosphotransferase system  glucose/maltose/N-acetylglucosamine-specific IIC component